LAMGDVSRDEHNEVLERLSLAEQTIKNQGQLIKSIQVRLDSLGNGGGGGGGGGCSGATRAQSNGTGLQGAALARMRGMMEDRSRSPMGRSMGGMDGGMGGGGGWQQQQQLGEGVVEQFCADNQLDQKSTEALCATTFEIQQNVLSQGPASGRNPSAMIMGRIKRASMGDFSSHPPGVQASPGDWNCPSCGDLQFRRNLVCRQCGASPPADVGGGGGGGRGAPQQQQQEMGFSGGFGGGVDDEMAQQVRSEVQTFIVENTLDEKSTSALMSASTECQAAVLNLGPAAGRNSSAMVMGRIRKFQAVGSM